MDGKEEDVNCSAVGVVSYKPTCENRKLDDAQEEAIGSQCDRVGPESESCPSRVIKNGEPTGSAGNEADGADEKLLPEDADETTTTSTTLGSCKVEIFDVNMSTANEVQNGDAKLEIREKTAFVGLTKDELMKYANDPFWVRLRWFLFIAFWVLWLTMLLGAAMIIYAAPKCDSPPPKTWWQQGPLGAVDTNEVANYDVTTLKQIGLSGVIVDYPEDSYLMTTEDSPFTKFVKTAAGSGLNVIVALDPSTSSRLFDSIQSNPNYFIVQQVQKEEGNSNEPPNNWISPLNGTAWMHSERAGFYYAPYGKPHLNLRNSMVMKQLLENIEKLISAGVNGVILKRVNTLLVDTSFANETFIEENCNKNDYNCYLHNKTKDLPELGPLLHNIGQSVKNYTVGSGVFLTDEELNDDSVYRVNSTLVFDMPVKHILKEGHTFNAAEFNKTLDSIFSVDNRTWPLWKYENNDIFDTVVFLLPGTPFLVANYTPNRELLKIRATPSVTMGSFSYQLVANDTVFVLNRLSSGNPGIIAAYNPTDSAITIDFIDKIPNISKEVTVVYTTGTNRNQSEWKPSASVKKNASALTVDSQTVVVLSYVPNLE